VLDQIDIDLTDHDNNSLASLATEQDIQSAKQLKEWDAVSNVWKNQPPSHRLHLFVQLRAAGEQKLVAVNRTLKLSPLLFHHSFMFQPLMSSFLALHPEGFMQPLSLSTTESFAPLLASAKIVALQAAGSHSRQASDRGVYWQKPSFWFGDFSTADDADAG
jgi:hypothetical protein